MTQVRALEGETENKLSVMAAVMFTILRASHPTSRRLESCSRQSLPLPFMRGQDLPPHSATYCGRLKRQGSSLAARRSRSRFAGNSLALRLRVPLHPTLARLRSLRSTGCGQKQNRRSGRSTCNEPARTAAAPKHNHHRRFCHARCQLRSRRVEPAFAFLFPPEDRRPRKSETPVLRGKHAAGDHEKNHRLLPRRRPNKKENEQ